MRKLIVKLVAFLLILGGLTASFLISKPKEEVKADEPILYYFDIDTSQTNYLGIILYVLDVANLQDDSCALYCMCSNKTPPYENNTYGYGIIQFSRYSALDHDDFDAYIYYYSYPSSSVMQSYNMYSIIVLTHNLTLDNNTSISYDLNLPFYPVYKAYYDSGYDDGYGDGTNDRNAYWEDYIQDTYLSTTGSGYQLIYADGRQDGYIEGQNSLDTMGWFGTITEGVSDIFALKLLPSITIGALIFIPLMFMILKGILYIWRKN